MTTGFVWHERYMWHNTGLAMGPVGNKAMLEPIAHPETMESKRRIKNLFDVSELTEQLTIISPRLATDLELLRVHTPEHLGKLKNLSQSGRKGTGK